MDIKQIVLDLRNMYLSLLQIKNFRCFDGNEHSITFKKARELLRATYLRALRDAYSEMQAGRHSRLIRKNRGVRSSCITVSRDEMICDASTR